MKTNFKRKIWVFGTLFLFLGASAALGANTRFWVERFDSYSNGQFLDGGSDDGGWEGWGAVPAAGAYVRNTHCHTSPNSVDISGASDLVHEFEGYTSGNWPFTCFQYIPSNFSGDSYYILLSGYDGGGSGTVWTAQVRFDSDLGVVESEYNGEQLPLVYDTWVEVRCNIDLDTDWLQIYYNGEILAEHAWTDTVQGTGGGTLNIAAVDFYANSASSIYYDDISFWYEPIICDAGGPYFGKTGQEIQFNGWACCGTPPLIWAWDFGDGATSSEEDPTHAYTTPGTYTVTLVVTDAISDTAIDSTRATINATPILEIGWIFGGFGITSLVQNTGDCNATNITWTIGLDGGFILLGRSTIGTIPAIAAGGNKKIHSGFVFGIGKTTIDISVTCDENVTAEVKASAFILGPFVLRV